MAAEALTSQECSGATSKKKKKKSRSVDHPDFLTPRNATSGLPAYFWLLFFFPQGSRFVITKS